MAKESIKNEEVGKDLSPNGQGLAPNASQMAGLPIEVADWEDAIPVQGTNGTTAYINGQTYETYFPEGYRHPIWSQEKANDPAFTARFVQEQKAQNEQNNAQRVQVQSQNNLSEKEKARSAARQRVEEEKRKKESPQVNSAPEAAAAAVEEAVNPNNKGKKKGRQLLAPAENDVQDQAVVSSDELSRIMNEAIGGAQQGITPPSQQEVSAPVSANDLSAGRTYKAASSPSTSSAASKAVDSVAGVSTDRGKIEEHWSNINKRDRKIAKNRNKSITQRLKNFLRKGGTREEFFKDPNNRYDPEEFSRFRKISDEMWGSVPGLNPKEIKTKIKDLSKIWKQMDDVSWSFITGFFHVSGENLITDKNGKSYLRWRPETEAALFAVEKKFGLQQGTEKSHRTVFRMVQLYASLGVDRHGKIFNVAKKDWSMSAEEFEMICDLMIISADTHGTNGNPFTRVRYLGKVPTLGGTNIYPSGVIPMAVASEITKSPNSCLQMTAEELVQAQRKEWLARIQPQLEAETAKTKTKRKRKTLSERKGKDGSITRTIEETEEESSGVGQRVVIETNQQALARIDGITVAEFSANYNIETTPHYTLEEYKDSTKEYAEAFNHNYDSDMVERRDIAKAEAWGEILEKNKDAGHIHPTIFGVKRDINIGWGASFVTKCVRGNALLANIPVLVGMIADHGLANVTTFLTLNTMMRTPIAQDNLGDWVISENMAEALVSTEFKQAMEACKLLFDTYGPGAVRQFCGLGKPMTLTNVSQFIREEYLPGESESRRTKIELRIDNITKKVIAGDYFFKGSDNMNWYRGLLVHNIARARIQKKLAEQGKVDKMGVALTSKELEDTFMARGSDPSWWLSDVMRDDMGIDAFLMMRGNNIADINPVSFNVQTMLTKHGVGEAAITLFVDNFPRYGLNYLWHMIPFSKTLTYLAVKRPNAKNVATNSDLVLGGNFGPRAQEKLLGEDGALVNDIGFREGLFMNLAYDSFTFGRFAGISGLLLGLVLANLGYEPPEDKRQMLNPSAWKVAGVEFERAFWINDLTLYGLPIATYIAAFFSTGDSDLAGKLFLNSLYEQTDGNVVLDTIDFIKNWQDDMIEIDQMMADPNYTGSQGYSWGALMLEEYILQVVNKLSPGAPLYRQISNSALLWGNNERARSTSKVWDRSDDWHRENKIAKYVDDQQEILERKAASANPWLAAFYELTRNIMSPNPEDKTSYFWWGMPPRTLADPITSAYGDVIDFDYNKRGNLTESQYDYLKTKELIQYINTVGFTGPEDAAAQGFTIPAKFRWAIKDVLYSEINFSQNDLNARVAAGEFKEYSSAWWDVVKSNNARKSDILEFVEKWIDAETIPTWVDGYEQLLTSYDEFWYNKKTGDAATWVDAALDWFSGKDEIVKEYAPKGNHPTNVLPLTWVDTENRGPNAETIANWYKEGYTDLDKVKELVGNNEITRGRFAGKKYGDVAFGGVGEENWSHPDIPTAGLRSYVNKE